MTEAQDRLGPRFADGVGEPGWVPPPPPWAFEWPGESSSIEAVLSALGFAAFVCDGRGTVRGMTPAAAIALEVGRLRLTDGRLITPSRYAAVDLEAAIAQAAAAGAPLSLTVVNRDRLDSLAVQVLDVIALRQPDAIGAGEPRVVVVLRGDPRAGAELERVLVRAFGLTTAEAEVAARLARGERREAIAAARRTSLQTVRSQIKNIFGKLGVTREPELVALLARLMRR